MTKEELLEVRTNQLMQEALREIGEHLETADRLAPVYVRAYLPPTVKGIYAPGPPSRLHPRIGAFCREIALDVVSGARFI